MDDLVSRGTIDSFFYVSSSEWNLYDFLRDFFQVKGLPQGFFFLKRLKTNPLKLLKTGSGRHDHKFESIEFLLNFFPEKTFYMIGDSGQKDIHIYMEIAKEYPERICGVLIRKIRKDTRKKILQEADTLFKSL